MKPVKLLDLLELTPLDKIAMPPLEHPTPIASDLFGHAIVRAASTTPAAKPDLGKMKAAIEELQAVMELEAGPLRRFFEEHGYDLANGDVLYHGPDVVIAVPERYRAQVVQHQMLEGRAMWFARNPRFSLF